MLSGSMVALVTPMTQSLELDLNALVRLIEWHLDQGTQGIIVNGTTGESPTLTEGEVESLVRVTVDTVTHRVPVIVGTGTNNTLQSIVRSKKAQQLGADACLVVTPYYNKPTQKGLIEHFSAIATQVKIPIVLYNVPGRTACDCLPKTVRELAKIDNIVGIKEAAPFGERVLQLLNECESDFSILSGDDETSLPFMQAGGHGVISVTANVAPRGLRRLCDAALSGHQAEARRLEQQLLPLHQALFVESNPIPVKWALLEMGLIDSGIRLPLTMLDERYHQRIREVIQPLLSLRALNT